MSVAQRWRFFRHMEYWDSIRMDDNRAAWDDLARYLARHGHPAEGVVASKVVLTRAWHEVPPPDGVGFFDRVDHPETQWQEFVFHTWEDQP